MERSGPHTKQTSADSTVRVSFLSGFSRKSCPVSVFCLDSVQIFCPVSISPDSVCLGSVSCLDFVRIFRKKAVRCLSVRILFKNSLSGICMDIVVILSVWISIDINTMPGQRHLSIRMWTQNLKTPTQTRTRMSERTYKNFESQTRTLVGIKSDS